MRIDVDRVHTLQLAVTTFLALIVGAIFFGVKDNQSGIQNRQVKSLRTWLDCNGIKNNAGFENLARLGKMYI